ncbi:MAG: JAB domain-containing protein [Opitutaceae bacterium]|nr:JAB domain-containing protein [Opitutaceae bacterium]
MIAYEASLTYQLVNFDAADPLANTKQMLAYLTKGVPETDNETFWVLAMNPKHRPICRQRLACGPLVATHVGVQKIFLSIALAEAKAFVCLRTQPSGAVQPTLADGRLAFNVREMAKLCQVEFVDYLITRLDARDYYSWRESGKWSE